MKEEFYEDGVTVENEIFGLEMEELNDEELETSGGASALFVTSANSVSIGNALGRTLSNIRVVSNPIGARYTIGLNKITITRAPGKKGMFKFTCNVGTVTVKFK